MQKLSSLGGGEASHLIRQRLENARVIQQARFAPVNKPGVLVNGDMGLAEVQKFCQLDKEGLAMIRMAVESMELSARAYHRLLKLSRTIADLAGSEQVQQGHLAEALQYRPRALL
jgi:magnesium chelatase family protein